MNQADATAWLGRFAALTGTGAPNLDEAEMADLDLLQEGEDEDRDNDGLSDAEEARLGTDPDNPDSDGDGYEDGEEVEAFTDPLVDDSLPDLRKLKLKRVELIDYDNSWGRLSGAEKAAIMELLERKDAQAKRSKRIKKYSFSLSAGEQGTTDRPGLDEGLAVATKNFAGVSKGKWDEDTPIAFRHLDTKIHEHPVDPPPVPGPLSLDAGSTFGSAKYKAGDMNSAVFNETLDKAAEYLEDLQDDFGEEVSVQIRVIAGESLVTPPKGMGTGDLARLRAETARAQAIKYFAARGIEVGNLDFADPKTVIGTTPYIRGESDPHADCYTQEQFLRIELEMVGTPPPPEPIEVEVLLVEPVFLAMSAQRKSGITWRWPKIDLNWHWPRRKKRRRRRRKKRPKFRTIECPKW